MASVNWRNGKFKSATECKAQFRHSAKDTRRVGQHSNKEIDTDKTKLNLSLFGLSYNELCSKYDKRIADLDNRGNKNRRKDRVTMIGLTIPMPLGMAFTDAMDYYKKVVDIVKVELGLKDDDIMELMIHFDEIHNYDVKVGDNIETHTSRPHGHLYFIPEVEEGLNAKKIFSVANIKRVNNAIHEMTGEDFDLKFMDGTKVKNTKSMRELKTESKAVANEREIVEMLDIRKTNLELQINELNDLYTIREEKLKKALEKAKQKYIADIVREGLKESEKQTKAVIEEANKKLAIAEGRLMSTYKFTKMNNFQDDLMEVARKESRNSTQLSFVEQCAKGALKKQQLRVEKWEREEKRKRNDAEWAKVCPNKSKPKAKAKDTGFEL